MSLVSALGKLTFCLALWTAFCAHCGRGHSDFNVDGIPIFISYSFGGDTKLASCFGSNRNAAARSLQIAICDVHNASAQVQSAQHHIKQISWNRHQMSVHENMLRLDVGLKYEVLRDSHAQLAPTPWRWLAPYALNLVLALSLNASVELKEPFNNSYLRQEEWPGCSEFCELPGWPVGEAGDAADLGDTLNLEAPRGSNVVLGIEVAWLVGGLEPTVRCSRAAAFHSGRWFQLLPSDLCGGIVAGHPVLRDQSGLNFTVPDSSAAPFTWNQSGVHNARLVLHAPLQHLVLPPAYGSWRGMHGVLPALSVHVHQLHMAGILNTSMRTSSDATVQCGMRDSAPTAWLVPARLQPPDCDAMLLVGLPTARLPTATTKPPHNTSDSKLGVQIPLMRRTMNPVHVSCGTEHCCLVLLNGRVKCWGANQVGNDRAEVSGAGRLGYADTQVRGLTEPVKSLDTLQLSGLATQVSAGHIHTCARLSTGFIQCWGSNTFGQLGYGHTQSIGDDEHPRSQGSVSIGEEVLSVSASGLATCALAVSSRVKCWGLNAGYPLGYETSSIGQQFAILAPPNTWLDIPGQQVDVQVGAVFACSLNEGGDVHCWGAGEVLPSDQLHYATAAGQGWLGHGDAQSVGGPSGLSIRDKGPVPVGGKVMDIAVGYYHSCALLVGGQVRCWGANEMRTGMGIPSQGRLGVAHSRSIGDDEPANASELVPLPEEAVAVCAGYTFSCALVATEGGSVMCWGAGGSGVLGFANDVSVAGSLQAPAPGSQGAIYLQASVMHMTCGAFQVCALLHGGALKCWGPAGAGMLGDGRGFGVGDNELPHQGGLSAVESAIGPAPPVPWLMLKPARKFDAVQISCEFFRCCAVSKQGRLQCWGQSGDGQLGSKQRAHIGDDEHYLSVPSVATSTFVDRVAVGRQMVCFLPKSHQSPGQVFCWGDNSEGALGIGNTKFQHPSMSETTLLTPVLTQPGERVIDLATGLFHACVVYASGKVQCWGKGGGNSALGYWPRGTDSDFESRPRLDVFADTLGHVVQISCSRSVTCAVSLSGGVQCWGREEFGALGYGDAVYDQGIYPGIDAAPSSFGYVPLPAGRAVLVSTADQHSCVLFHNGSVSCWGAGASDEDFLISSRGKLGYGNIMHVGVGSALISRSQGSTFFDQVFAKAAALPRDAGYVSLSSPAVHVVAGRRHTCVILVSSELQCFGQGLEGALATGKGENVGDSPETLPSIVGPSLLPHNVKDVGMLNRGTCVVFHSGDLHCVGQDTDGSLGVARPTQTVGREGLPRYILAPVRYALDMSAELYLTGFSPAIRLVGSAGAWNSITQVEACPSCDTSKLLSIPPWLFDALKHAETVNLPAPSAVFGVACDVIQVAPQNGNAICGGFAGCSLEGPFSTNLQPWSKTCVWPANWKFGALPFIDRVRLASSPLGRPARVSSTGGDVVQLSGQLWTLGLFAASSNSAEHPCFSRPIHVRFDNLVCGSPRIISATAIECIAPALVHHDVAAGLQVTVQHCIEGILNPIIAAERIYFRRPRIAALFPASGIAQNGQEITISGSDLGPAISWANSTSTKNVADLVHIRIFRSENQSADFLLCLIQLPDWLRQESSIRCKLPSGTGIWSLKIYVAQQASNTLQFRYASPIVDSVDPPFLTTAPSVSPVDIALSGFNLGLATSNISVSIAGRNCLNVTRQSATGIKCHGFSQGRLAPSGLESRAAVTVQVDRDDTVFAPAITIYGDPQIFSLSPLQIPQNGSLITLFGLNFAPREVSALQARRYVEAVWFGSGEGAVFCLVREVSNTQILCILPAGAGGLLSATVSRSGGATAVFSSPDLQYAPPRLEGVLPEKMPLPVTWSSYNFALRIYGQGFASRPGASNISEVRLVAGLISSACSSLVVISDTELECKSLSKDLVWTDDMTSIEISVRLPGMWQTPPFSVPVLGHPSISALRPALASAAGSQLIQVLGSNLWDGQSHNFSQIMIGNSICGSVQYISASELRCVSPRLAEAGSATPSVRIRTATGFVSTAFENLLFYSVPEILRVEGATALTSVSNAARARLHTVSLSGLALGSGSRSSSHGPGMISIGNQSCEHLHGRMQLGPDGRSLTCYGLDTSLLPTVEPGAVRSFPLQAHTNEGVFVDASDQNMQIVGPPLLTRLSVGRAVFGASLSIFGANLGLSAEDVVAVYIGSMLTDFARTSSSSLFIESLPTPSVLSFSSLIDLNVTVQLISGHAATLAAAFSYIIPPQTPLTSPKIICAYREKGVGAFHVIWAWNDDSSTLLTPISSWWIALADEAGTLETRTLSSSNNAAGELVTTDSPPHRCRAKWELQEFRVSSNTAFFDARLLNLPARPLWVRVAASTGAANFQTIGPQSVKEGPVFPACLLSEYLSTQFAAEGRWRQAVCRQCPPGARCNGQPWEALSNAAGFFRIPWSRHGLTFSRCSNALVCPAASPSPVSITQLGHLLPTNISAPNASNMAAFLPDAFQELTVTGLSMGVADELTDYGAVQVQGGCVAGHTGLLCSKCSQGFGQVGAGLCQPCTTSPEQSVFLLLLFAVAILAVVAFLVRSQVRSRAVGRKGHSIIKKVLLSHLQQTALMLAFDLKWPTPLSETLAASDTAGAAASSLAAVDCARGGGWESAFRIVVIVTLATPLCAIFVLSLVFLAGFKCGRLERSESMRRCLLSVLVVGYLFYSPLTRTILQLFTCVNIAGQERLLEDRDILCASSSNQAWVWGVGVPSFLMFVLGFPLGVGVALIRMRSKLQESSWHRRTFGLFYLGYKEHYFWYELVVMGRKALFALVLVLLRPVGLLWQLGFGLLVLTIAGLISARLRPYKQDVYNHLDMASIALSIGVLAGGSLLYQHTVADLEAATGRTTSMWPYFLQADQGISVLLASLNILFVASLALWWLLTLYRSEIQPAIKRALHPQHSKDSHPPSAVIALRRPSKSGMNVRPALSLPAPAAQRCHARAAAPQSAQQENHAHKSLGSSGNRRARIVQAALQNGRQPTTAHEEVHEMLTAAHDNPLITSRNKLSRK